MSFSSAVNTQIFQHAKLLSEHLNERDLDTYLLRYQTFEWIVWGGWIHYPGTTDQYPVIGWLNCSCIYCSV